jgi:hypothetical protein
MTVPVFTCLACDWPAVHFYRMNSSIDPLLVVFFPVTAHCVRHSVSTPDLYVPISLSEYVVELVMLS